MQLNNVLARWTSDTTISEAICAQHITPPRAAVLSPFPELLHPAITSSLKENGVDQLYAHQVLAWDLVQEGGNIVVSTGTASGKSLCYNLPVLNRLIKDMFSRSLYIFPTKALAQDQANSLSVLLSGISRHLSQNIVIHSDRQLNNTIALYDGDTPPNKRPLIRNNTGIIFTNPDMLHLGILPHHTVWEQFFSHLKFVVIDEIHIYRGVFGSHVANVIRRLKRIANFYGSSLQFILTSATISNPTEHAARLIEEDVVAITEDGSARGEQTFYLYNPPLINMEFGIRRSALHESTLLANDLLTYDIQSIIFCRSRRTVELVLSYLRQGSFPNKTIANQIIRGYRSGYLSKDRREIEKEIREGKVRIVVATNALELGIDIGGMDAVLMVGYPGTIASTQQQAGRAGRSEEPSLVVLVATAAPLDQFLTQHPEYLFERSPEHALINPDNLLILLSHIKCATFELPFSKGDEFGTIDMETLQEFLEFIAEERQVLKSGERYYWMSEKYPAQEFSLRTISPESVEFGISAEGSTIGVIDRDTALWMTHPQAIYLHEGTPYYVNELDLVRNTAWLNPIDSDYFTEPRRDTKVELLQKHIETSVKGGTKSQGEIEVITQVIGYKKIKWYTHEVIGIGDLDLPPNTLQTTAYWISLSEALVSKLRDSKLWKNDPNEYGKNWQKQRDLARARDNYRCQLCGVSETDHTHDVHHKIPYRLYPIPEQANHLDNLITLCKRCHKQVELSVRVRSGLSGMAYVIAHLAPLFLMCDIHDIGVHSDPKLHFANGAPSVILYDQIPAGLGFSQRIYEIHNELMLRSYELIKQCQCQNGCPSCIGPGGQQDFGGKTETLAILGELID